MSKFDELRKGGITAILLGVIVFILSSIFINHNIDPEDEEIRVYLSTNTNFVDSKNGAIDTFFLGSRELIQDYFDSLETEGGIFIVDLRRHHIKKEYSLIKDSFHVSFDTSHHKVDTSFYFKRSNILYQTLFYSTDSSKLSSVIDGLDEYTFEKVAVVANKSRHLFNRYPQLLVWALLISIVIGYSFALVPLFVGEIKGLTEGGSNKVWLNYLGLSIFIIICLFIPLIVTNYSGKNFLLKPADFETLFQFGVSKNGLGLNSSLPFAGTLVWLVLVFCTNRSVLELGKQNEEAGASMSRFVSLRKGFERNLILISILMAFGIFSTDILINTLNDLAGTSDKYQFFPAEFAFVNGLMQTFFLVLIYFVVNGSFQYTKEVLVANSPADMVKAHKLDQGKKPMDYLRLILTILAPVLGSSIPELIKLIFQTTGA